MNSSNTITNKNEKWTCFRNVLWFWDFRHKCNNIKRLPKISLYFLKLIEQYLAVLWIFIWQWKLVFLLWQLISMQTQIINFRAYIVSLGNFDNLNVCNLISQMLSYHTWMWGTESNVQVLFIFIKKKVFISSRNHNVKIWLVTIDKYVFIYHWRRLMYIIT